MSFALFAPICSITSTRRRRFLWAAWWTGAPTSKPFRKPDAFQGGAHTRQDALRAAERAAGFSLLEVDGRWAKAWAKILVGQDPWSGARPGSHAASPGRVPAAAKGVTIWDTLGLKPNASVLEIKAAYRKRALETHPDRGGSAPEFRAVQAAYESALKRRARAPSARKVR
jgi:hypothetical protein